MRYLTLCDTRSIEVEVIGIKDSISILDALYTSGVPEMFEALFGVPFIATDYLNEEGRVTPAECRMVSDFWHAYCQARRGEVAHLVLANLNESITYVVSFI